MRRPRRSGPLTSSLRPPASSRRGVLLLVVLSLLVLFLLVGTAFVITAKQSEKAAKAAHRGTLRLSSAAAMGDLLDEVLLQLVRDTNNAQSRLRFHSLLGDLYGNDALKSEIVAADWPGGGGVANVTGGQTLELRLSTAIGKLTDYYGNLTDASTPPQPLRFSNLYDAYSGQVLTFLNGPARGRSTRIVGFIPPDRFRVMNVELEDGSIVTDPTVFNPNVTVAPPSSVKVLINGRPFSGTGVGFNPDPAVAPGTPRLNAQETVDSTAYPLALLPNTVFVDWSKVQSWTVTNPSPASFSKPHVLPSQGRCIDILRLEWPRRRR